MMTWWATRVGVHCDSDVGYCDDVVLMVADESDVVAGLQQPILRGRVECDFDTGRSRVTSISHNVAMIPADSAVTMLLAIDGKVEGCDDGEVAAVPVVLDQWLATLFEDDAAKEIARMLSRAVT